VLRRIFGPKSDEKNRRLHKTAQRGVSQRILFVKYNQNDQVKESEIIRVCSTYEGRRIAHTSFGEKTRKEETIARAYGFIWLRIGTSGGLF
jgi:hypothetical protein